MSVATIGLVTALTEAFIKLEPIAQKEVVALVNKLRGEKNQPPIAVDWTAIDAKFEKDLAAQQATEKPPG